MTVRAALQEPDTAIGFSARIASLWGMIGITSWADFAAFAASVYSMLLVAEWLWKRLLRPFCEEHGWWKRRSRRRTDES
jgi:hypothetical protein